MSTVHPEINNLYNKKKYAYKQIELLEELMTWELRVQDPLPVPRNRYHFKLYNSPRP